MTPTSTSTVEVRINADGVGWVEPNPVPNQPPVDRAGRKGDVVKIPVDEATRLRGINILVHYTDPVTGIPNGVARWEPAVVDATEVATSDSETAEVQREISEHEAALSELRAKLPLQTAPTPPGVEAVPLNAARTGVRLLNDESDLDPGDGESVTVGGAKAPATKATGSTKRSG